ncbi:MAG: hypothetical protein KKB81_05880 [Candidatus Margulisbacteria bacterium]|nr:hypothetical protein [Candidatus Margulisiibacteriota bacterium]MBU1021826.1 hypothetical protein [Candidatus Margulisiibacteriota bacterium]MBU1728985.1 hypothetical protein [Candidatus Margulisiibacteriota bacterium]MBU1954462.1 hypothetical protein [Candidatus Margulisiibacteriota bacterium]
MPGLRKVFRGINSNSRCVVNPEGNRLTQNEARRAMRDLQVTYPEIVPSALSTVPLRECFAAAGTHESLTLLSVFGQWENLGDIVELGAHRTASLGGRQYDIVLGLENRAIRSWGSNALVCETSWSDLFGSDGASGIITQLNATKCLGVRLPTRKEAEWIVDLFGNDCVSRGINMFPTAERNGNLVLYQSFMPGVTSWVHYQIGHKGSGAVLVRPELLTTELVPSPQFRTCMKLTPEDPSDPWRVISE